MNSQRILRISTVTEAQNHPILGLIFLPFSSSVLKTSYLVLVGSGVFFYDEDVHPFTYSFILATLILLLHLYIPISSSSLMLPLISSFIISTRLFLLHLGILISFASLLLPFTYSFIISTLSFLLHLRIPIASSSLLRASL